MDIIKQSEFEKIKSQEKKPVKVHFKTDFDISDILTRFGNWSRLGLYLRQNTPSYYENQPKKLKEICSDNDAELINEALLSILALNIPNSKDIYDVLMYIYFGEKKEIKDYIMDDGYVLQSYKELAKETMLPINYGRLGRGIKVETISVVKPLSVMEIAEKLETNWNAIDKLKKKGEDFLNGYISAMSKVGKRLELLICEKYLS